MDEKLEKQMTRWAEEKAVETVLALIAYRETHGIPFRGIQDDVADLVGVNPTTFGTVLSTARTAEFVRKHGYVIPFVKKGMGDKEWIAVATQDPLDLGAIQEGERIHKRDAITIIKRIFAQSEYRSPTFDARTKVGKREKDAMVQLEAALISLEQSLNGI
jgi:hypothetical protein